MNMHFISGLPRSGSTLLSGILRQNPRFHAAMTSPVNALCMSTLHKMSGASQFAMFFTDDKRHQILKGIFDSYYADRKTEIVFDTNRVWTSRTALLAAMYPKARIICCVRDIGWIIDSVERVLRSNPFQTSRLFNFEPGQSVYARAEILMNFESGLVGHAWSCLREAWFSEQAARLLVIDYKALTQRPAAVMSSIYAAIDEQPFAHDFDNVIYEAEDFDTVLGMPGMHTLKRKVEYKERASCIPPDLLAKHADLQFWRRPELRRTGITVIN